MKRAAVETYRGPIEPELLGTTLMHEHIFVRNPELEMSMSFPEWDTADQVERAVESLTALHELGIDTIVDLTVPGLGRDPQTVSLVANRVPVNLVAATGWYGAAVLPPYFQFNRPDRLVSGSDPLIELFVRDIEHGIGNSGIRAAMIKVTTTDAGITTDEVRTLTAAAVAAQQTGVAITTHSNPAQATGREQQQLFRSLGFPLERLVIGHSGDTTDLVYLRELMDDGSTIGLDRFGMEHVLDDESRLRTLMALVGLGYSDRIVLSQDAAVFSHVTPPSWRAENTPRWNLANISHNILPWLRQEIDAGDIDRMLIENPRRILSPVPGNA